MVQGVQINVSHLNTNSQEASPLHFITSIVINCDQWYFLIKPRYVELICNWKLEMSTYAERFKFSEVEQDGQECIRFVEDVQSA